MERVKYDCCCYSLLALNIIDFEGRCQNYLSSRAPHMEWALLSLRQLGQKCKLKTDRNGVEYEISHHVNCFLKDLSASLTMELNTLSSLTKLKYLYFKRKLTSILKGNFFNDYLCLMRKKIRACTTSMEGEELVKKFINVCKTLKLPVELSGEDVEQYEFMAELLNFCNTTKIKNSGLVISLLKMTIDRCGIAPFDSLYVRQPLYPEDFLEYILEHVRKEKFDMSTYCLHHPRTLWEYSRNFSVINAVSFGNIQRVKTLLQYGFEVFPNVELRRSSHGFPYIDDILPTRYLMVLRMMCCIRSVNLFLVHSPSASSNRLYIASDEQKQCFYLLWQAIQDPYVKHAEMLSAIFAEYLILAKHNVLNPMRYEKNVKFSMMYERCFTDLASGQKEPRSLMHLSRYAIRDRLKESWNLPHGIFQLPVPKRLHEYLNLESD
ncbi:uncharacterized protein [Parasteatoda tepidariorum]|uniref:uncharacterized protein n=1 Tax=Parasteatoda tepidariorum TaxID=114398 RepID=UPI00077FDFC6|nr:uncharacterized protein LOC107457108 [Parasteatoda tepidariorum]